MSGGPVFCPECRCNLSLACCCARGCARHNRRVSRPLIGFSRDQLVAARSEYVDAVADAPDLGEILGTTITAIGDELAHRAAS